MADRKDEKDPLRLPPFRCDKKFTTEALGVTSMTLHNWTKAGCPRNPDKTYSLPLIFEWKIQQVRSEYKSHEVEDEKKKKDIEYREAQIQRIRGNFIERSVMETVLVSRALNLKRYLTKTFLAEATFLVGKPVETMRTALYNLAKKAMDAYIGESDEYAEDKARPPATTGGERSFKAPAVPEDPEVGGEEP